MGAAVLHDDLEPELPLAVLTLELGALLLHDLGELLGREIPHPLSGLAARGGEGLEELPNARGRSHPIRRLGAWAACITTTPAPTILLARG